MLLWEILAPTRTLMMSARFSETFREYHKTYPVIKNTLRHFVEFRLTHRPDEHYAAKDQPFASFNALHSYRHFHMVHGKVVLIYQITPTELRLCCVTNHSYDTSKGRTQLIHTLTAQDYQPLADDPPKALSPKQTADLRALFFSFAGNDRATLERAANGDLSGLIEFMRLVIDESWDETELVHAILAAFGGNDGLTKTLNRVLHHTQIRD